MRFWLFGLALLVSFAGSVEAAGFAKEALFLSKTPVTEGEEVLIHAVIANNASETFAGKVVFKSNEEQIGSVAVSIAPGGANTVSVSWKPIAGSHKVIAELTTKDELVAESHSATFYIEKKPEPEAAGGNVESSSELQEKIGRLSPSVAGVSAPVFSVLDSARAKAAETIDDGIAWAKDTSEGKKPAEVLGAATEDTSGSGIVHTLWLILGTIAYWVLSALRFIVGSAGIFYPVFAVAFLYMLWRLYKRMRRPAY